MNAPFRGLRLRLGRRSIDPGFAAASALFLLALAAAAWPALRTDPASAPGLLLLIGLAGVAFLAVFAFGAAETRDRRDGDAFERLLAGFEEPAALATPEGRIVAANAAWTETSGGARRLPRGPAAPALFVALAEARAGRVGRAAVRLGELDFEALVSGLGEGRFLVRAATEGPLAQPRLLGWAGQAAGPAARAGAGGRRARARALRRRRSVRRGGAGRRRPGRGEDRLAQPRAAGHGRRARPPPARPSPA